MKLKGADRHRWDDVQGDTRPSEFASTTGLAARSGFHASAVMPASRASTRRRSRIGLKTTLVYCAILVVLGACAIARWRRCCAAEHQAASPCRHAESVASQIFTAQ